MYDFWLENLEASVPLWTEWVKSWDAVGLLRQGSPLITKQHGGVHALSLGNKREGPVCRLLRGMQGLFIAAFMHAMWLELLRTAKLGTEGTQLALRTAMKVGGAGVKKEKRDISDDDLDADAEIEEGNATVGGVFGNAGNIPVSKEKKGTEQSKGKGRQKGGNGQTSSAPPADEQGLLVVCNGRHGELYASLVFLADGNVKGRTNCCYHSIEAHIGKNPVTLNKFAALSGKGSFNKWKQGVVKVQGIGEVPEQNLELLLFNGKREGFMMAAQLQRSGGSAAAVADSGDAQVEIVELPPE